ncbi:MAG: hypothetical protein QXQ39_08160, partial [Conexivisphaerales archaeon]
GQWWYRSDLGINKIYTGATYGAVSAGNNQMVATTSTLPAGSYSDILIPPGVTLTLASGSTYNFTNIYNYGTISDSGATSNYTGKDGLMNYGTYTLTGSATINGISGGIYSGSGSISIPSGASLTLSGIVLNTNITGAGTLVIPANAVASVTTASPISFTMAALTLNGTLYVSSAVTSLIISTAVTYGSAAKIVCDGVMQLADSNAAFCTANPTAPAIGALYNTYPGYPPFFASGNGFIAYCKSNTSTGIGTSSTALSAVSMMSLSGGTGTGKLNSIELTAVTAAYPGWFSIESERDSTTTLTVYFAIYCGSTSTYTIPSFYMTDTVANTSGATANSYYGTWYYGFGNPNGIIYLETISSTYVGGAPSA